MATTSAACCANHAHMMDEYDEVDMINDPTLMSCCERDRRESKKASELKSLLTAHDPTTQNVRMRQQLLTPGGSHDGLPGSHHVISMNEQQAAAQVARSALKAGGGDDDDVASDSDSDLDLDGDMEELLAMRRLQLAAQFQQSAKDVADGYGVILETDARALAAALKTSPEIPRVVFVHMNATGATELTNMFTEMRAVAQRYMGTKFYSLHARNTDRDTDSALRQLGVGAAAHSLLAFRRGQRVDILMLQERELAASCDVLWEARVVPWLGMCNVLETSRQDAPQPTAGGTSRSTSKPQRDADSDDDADVIDCGMEGCRIRFAYEHEHVGPSQASKAEISAWRSA